MRDIADTIKAGERNRDTLVLVHNWCAHARMEKFGGTGMIEAATGLPIGHHGMRCDYAPEGGFASWDFRDSVIEFYDRNCSTCSHRKPVRLPNILEIIAERDRSREAQAAANASAQRDADAALDARRNVRAALKPKLGAVAQTLVDDIDAYDADRSQENFDRVTQSARLAPEHFVPALVDYVADLAASSHWFIHAALIILDAASPDDPRIVTLAVTALEIGFPLEIAALKLVPRISEIPPDAIPRIIRGAVDLARPRDPEGYFRGDDEPWPERRPELLELLYSLHAGPILAAIEGMLLTRRRASLEHSGRGLGVLQSKSPDAARPILRTIVSTYVRAPSLVSDLKDDGDRLPDLANALNDAFEDAPEQVDALLQEYADNAPVEQRIRIYKVYALGLYVPRDSPPVPSNSKRHSIALQRLVWAPTIERDDNALRQLASAFRPHPDRLTAVVREQLDALLGAILLMADRLAEIDASKSTSGDTVLAAMERGTRRVMMRGIMENYVEWAGAAAVGDAASIGKIVALFDEVPEGREELIGTLLGATKELASDITGLNGLLPHLYQALVGSSVLVRSYAATAVGDLPYGSLANIPDLVFEAFSALLWDQYVAVHKTAVRAFRRSIVPEAHRPRAAEALMNLIRVYRMETGEDAFLAECVHLAAGMTDLFGTQSQNVRRYLIEVAMDIEPLYLSSEISSLAYTLGEEPSFAKLVARMLPDLADRYNGSDSAQELLRRLPAESRRLHAAELREAALAVLEEDFVLALVTVEVLVEAGAQPDVLALCRDLKARLGSTTRTYSRRAALSWPEFAIRFERAVAEGDSDQLAAIASEWAKAAAEFEAHEEDDRERRSRSNLPF